MEQNGEEEGVKFDLEWTKHESSVILHLRFCSRFFKRVRDEL